MTEFSASNCWARCYHKGLLAKSKRIRERKHKVRLTTNLPRHTACKLERCDWTPQLCNSKVHILSIIRFFPVHIFLAGVLELRSFRIGFLTPWLQLFKPS